MLNEKRYHVTKGFPQDIINILEKASSKKYMMTLEYTQHALKQAVIYGCVENLPKKISWKDCYVFEVAVVNDLLDKVVLRTSYDKNNDIILIINAANPRVRTLWINKKNDRRNEKIDLQKYDIP